MSRKGTARGRAGRGTSAAARTATAVRLSKAPQQVRPGGRGAAPKRDAGTGTAWMVTVGWLLTVAGAVGFVAVVGPRWAATVGDGLDYVVHPTLPGTPTWAVDIALVGPLLGFNLIYFGHSPRRRTPALLVLVALLTTELLVLVVAAVWTAGAGRRASHVTGGEAFIPLLFVLLTAAAAAAIMAWLGGRSTFERQSVRYFATGRATVDMTPIGLPARCVWVLASGALVVVLAIVPARLAVDRLDARYVEAPQRAWPQPWASDSGLATAVALLGLVLGAVLGICVSMLIKAVLYRTVLAEAAAWSRARRGRSVGLRTLQFVHHWPIAVAGMWWTFWLSWGVAEDDAGSIVGGIGVPLWLGFAPLVLGLLLVSQVWRAQDQSGRARPMRLQMGGRVQ